MTRPTTPQVGIGIVIIRDAQVLLIRRGKPPGEGAWSLPGGRQELGETAEDCARRELFEETGLACGALTLVGHVDSIHRDAAGAIEYHYTILDFAGHYTEGEARAGGDVTEVAWATAQEFDAYALWPPVRRLIAKAFSLSPP
jgi:ADP-ribose pyrophosphatase YjhB (NUDIX family)